MENVEWDSIEANREIMEVLEDGEMDTRMSLLEIIYDLKSWIRQIEVDEVDKWKQSCFIWRGFTRDVRLQMDRGQQRTSRKY